MFLEPLKYHTTLKWFVILTRSRAEKKVAERLTEINILVYLPVYNKQSHWSDRTKNIELPLIPSVIFVHCTEQQLPAILKAAGTVRVLKYLRKPAVVHEYEIENLKIMLQQANKFEPLTPMSLMEGELIEVISGPFKGLKATYIEHLGKFKIIVLIKALHAFFQVEVAANAIKKIRVAV